MTDRDAVERAKAALIAAKDTRDNQTEKDRDDEAVDRLTALLLIL